MNDVIFKYRLPLIKEPKVQMPDGAEVIHVGMQDDQITLWAKVDSNAEMETRNFAIAGTGRPDKRIRDAVHLGTVFDGGLVWHVFEID